ncbi:hypothetical protein [Sutcliffiella rhizosphaerae]|uniref:Ethanolamine utilization protein n=1 Tax=Sutcliffiella rhizosphaerae TaxID=2880967 RepID=A0ABN8A5D1_9BACI|nr:hypothetical protein [Sutcliffiella rhizosphaerae]CAG9620304.1 hypothetical protein BACCIP111883_01072 [Sutcliffiella rhizosphaerae]
MNKRELVEQIVLEVLKRLPITDENTKVVTKRNLLVYKSKSNETITSPAMEHSWNIISKSVEDETVPNDVHAVLFLHGSRDLLVKGALGITDTPETSRLASILMQGIDTTIIPTEMLKQVIYEDERKVVNNEYMSQLLTYKKKLESFGVSFQSFAAFEERLATKESTKDVSTFEGPLLTERDIYLQEEDIIYISSATIITPLARDAARELRKTIHRLDPKGAD